MAFKYTRSTGFRGAEYDTDLYLVVANVREGMAVSKQAAWKFDGKRFNNRKLNELEVRNQHQIEVAKRFSALERNDGEDIYRAWEIIKQYQNSAKQSLALHNLKQHKPWFDEECLGLIRSTEAG
jgi:hypothetical protein